VLLAVDGLHPPSTGARVSFSGGKSTVTDGPFSEAKEVIGGYWMIEVKSKAEAIEWASRCPGLGSEVIEVRQVQEMADLPPETPASRRLSAARIAAGETACPTKSCVCLGGVGGFACLGLLRGGGQ